MEKLTKLKWPIYRLGSYINIETKNKITIVETEHNRYILDNKNLSGDTLGKRRVALNNYPLPLYNSFKIAYTLADIVILGTGTYIDTNGYLFKYTKRKRAALIYSRVLNIKCIDNRLYCKCSSIPRQIEIPFIPETMPKYLGLIKFKQDYLLYELCQERKKNTWRLI